MKKISNTKYLFLIATALLFGIKAELNAESETYKKVNPKAQEGRSFLGIYMDTLTTAQKTHFKIDSGIRIDKIILDSPADVSGLKKNYIILTMAGKEISSIEDLILVMNKYKPEETIKIKALDTKGNPLDFMVTLVDRDEFDKLHNVDTLFYGNQMSIGISVQILTEQLANFFGVKHGILVSEVDPLLTAAEAGVKTGDVITEIDNTKIFKTSDFYSVISKKDDHDFVKLTITRDKKNITLPVEVKEIYAEKSFHVEMDMSGDAFIISYDNAESKVIDMHKFSELLDSLFSTRSKQKWKQEVDRLEKELLDLKKLIEKSE